MDLDDLKAKIEDFKSLRKEDLENALQDMRTRFEEKTGLDLTLLVKSYKTALAGTREEKVELRSEALEEGKETEYWLGYGMSFGDRTTASAILEAIGTKVPSVKYVARVLESYVVTDALLSAIDRSLGGLVREGAEKVKDKISMLKSGRASLGDSLWDSLRASSTEEGLVDWLDDAPPAELGEPELPEEKEENPYF